LSHGIDVAAALQEETLRRQTYGILAGVIGSAVGAWFWSRQRSRSTAAPAGHRGTVIFHNTPTPTALSEAEAL
jgi:hypothetical protein